MVARIRSLKSDTGSKSLEVVSRHVSKIDLLIRPLATAVNCNQSESTSVESAQLHLCHFFLFDFKLLKFLYC